MRFCKDEQCVFFSRKSKEIASRFCKAIRKRFIMLLRLLSSAFITKVVSSCSCPAVVATRSNYLHTLTQNEYNLHNCCITTISHVKTVALSKKFGANENKHYICKSKMTKQCAARHICLPFNIKVLQAIR